MTRNSKKTTKQPAGSDREDQEKLGLPAFIGIGLLAGALFNIPAIMKVPETTADKMMLVIVLAMAAGGAILLLFGRRK